MRRGCGRLTAGAWFPALRLPPLADLSPLCSFSPRHQASSISLRSSSSIPRQVADSIPSPFAEPISSAPCPSPSLLLSPVHHRASEPALRGFSSTPHGTNICGRRWRATTSCMVLQRVWTTTRSCEAMARADDEGEQRVTAE